VGQEGARVCTKTHPSCALVLDDYKRLHLRSRPRSRRSWYSDFDCGSMVGP